MSDRMIDIEATFSPRVLREYALLADGERGALIGPQGDIAWMCAPRWDSDAVFSNLIGGGGVYAITPTDMRYVWGGYYEPGTLIWRNRWITRDGIVECREALCFPGEPGRVVLLRRLIGCRGTARVRVLLQPGAEFGTWGAGRPNVDDGIWTGKSGKLRWRWLGGCDARAAKEKHDGKELLACDLTVDEGQHHDLVLELSERTLPDPPPDPDIAWTATEDAWHRSVPELNCAIAEHDGRHSYAVLRGLTSSGGGMVAAATMSLPERAHTNQNYDYRYAWIRDQVYAGIAAATVGASELLDCAVEFVGARLLEDGPNLKPAYTVTGGASPAKKLSTCPATPAEPTKSATGSTSNSSSTSSARRCSCWPGPQRPTGSTPTVGAPHETAIAAIEKRWHEPDAGIWEIDDENWTQSRLACVAGLRAIARWPARGPTCHRVHFAGRRHPGRHRRRSACIREMATGSAARGWPASTLHCCCHPCAAPFPSTTPVPGPPWTPFAGNSPTTASSTASGMTSGPRRRRRRLPALWIHDGARRTSTGP